jgi:hypothetical protein
MPSNTENFKKYPNEIFIETGSYVGDGIQQALDAGFKSVISIELSDKYYTISSNRFIYNTKVKIIKGDSFKVLPELLKNINEPVTFWLDGHHSCGDTALGDYWAPLIQELDVIKEHPVKTHTIMIDDMRCWQAPNPVHGFYKDDIFEKLKEINPDYKFTYEDGLEKNDILVASII